MEPVQQKGSMLQVQAYGANLDIGLPGCTWPTKSLLKMRKISMSAGST